MPIRKQFENEQDFLRALRDYFAGQALIGIISFNGDIKIDGISSENQPACLAYKLADNMLIGRQSISDRIGFKL